MYTRYRDMSMARFVQARIFCVVLFCVLEFRGWEVTSRVLFLVKQLFYLNFRRSLAFQ